MTEFAIAQRRLNMARFDGVGVFGKSREQRLVRDQIHAPRQPARCTRNHLDDALRKQIRPVVTRRAQAKHQVFAHVIGIERRQPETMRDALAQLADIGLTQILIELRLPEQHYLQQLVVSGFKIRQQADFLEGSDGHALRFLDKHHHALAGGVARQQIILHRLHDLQTRRGAIQRQL